MFGFLRRHKTTLQTWQGDVVTMSCKCGGTIKLESAKRAPVYLDAMPIPIGVNIEGIVTESSCKKHKANLPLAKVL